MKTISNFEVKIKLSEVIASAERRNSQFIKKSGRKTAAVFSYQAFERLPAKKVSLVEFLLDNLSKNDLCEIGQHPKKEFTLIELILNG